MLRLICWAMGPTLFIFLGFLFPLETISLQARIVLATLAWMFVWWLFEVVPLAVTSLLPLITFPVFDVANLKTVAASYSAEVIYLFLGGFLLARAIEKWGVHFFLARKVLGHESHSPQKALLMFIGLTAFLSMWISNTAAALVVLPLITTLKHPSAETSHRIQKSFRLAVAYGASVGGVATLIGSPPNAIMASIAQQQLGVKISFLDWMLFGVPLAILGCLIIWIYLAHFAYRIHSEEKINPISHDASTSIGPAQKRVLMVFAVTVIAWIASGAFSSSALSDASIAMLAVIALFSLPSGEGDQQRILNSEDLLYGGWPVLLLFGGGLALSIGIDRSGLGTLISHSLHSLSSLSPFIVVLAATGFLILLTEVSSNTAIAAIFVPLVLSIAPVVGLPPLMAMMTVTMAGSLSFMLPMATPPNAVVFASGGLSIREMMKCGLGLNILFWITISLSIWFLLPLVWNIQ
jgi:sodium-dependent dicarboxylate transporter 2/3/5